MVRKKLEEEEEGEDEEEKLSSHQRTTFPSACCPWTCLALNEKESFHMQRYFHLYGEG